MGGPPARQTIWLIGLPGISERADRGGGDQRGDTTMSRPCVERRNYIWWKYIKVETREFPSPQSGNWTFPLRKKENKPVDKSSVPPQQDEHNEKLPQELIESCEKENEKERQANKPEQMHCNKP